MGKQISTFFGMSLTKKRIFTFILAVVMVFSLLPVPAMAQTTNTADVYVADGASASEKENSTKDTAKAGLALMKAAPMRALLGATPAHSHTDWTAWGSKSGENTALPTTAGSYYLTANVTLSNVWSVPKGTTNLCLNGYVITQTSDTIHVISIEADATLNLYDCGTITHSFSVDGDTGLWKLVSSGGSETLTGGVITGGHPTGCCGGVYVNKSGIFNMYGGNIVGNTAGGGSGDLGGGGGVFVYYGATFNMNGGTICGNTSKNGGGVYVRTDGVKSTTFTMNGGTIRNNRAESNKYGGGVYIEDGNFIINGGTITGNKASRGTGVYLLNGNFTMEDGTISENVNGYGAVWIADGKYTMNGGEISRNTTTSGGDCSGVYVAGGSFILNGGNITENVAPGDYSNGCIYVKGIFEMNGGNISGNTSGGVGGGVLVGGGTFTMTNGSITGNTAGNTGGGVYVSSGTFTMLGGSITGNTAKNSRDVGGGGVYVQTPTSPATAEMILGGSAVISGNVMGGTITNGVLSGGTPANVYLKSGKSITLETGENAPTDKMWVGVTMETATVGTVVATGAVSGMEKYFYSDATPFVILQNSGSLKLGNATLHTHDSVTFTPWSSSVNMPAATGSYHLTHDVKLSSAWVLPTGTTKLCLDGYVLDLNGYNIQIGDVSTLVLYDCNGSNQTYKGHLDSTGLWHLDEGTYELQTGEKDYPITGGVITGGKGFLSDESNTISGGAIYAAENGNFTMNSGTIAGNTASYGGGVYIYSFSSYANVLTINGGKICGNTANGGGGVYFFACGKINITGGAICDNTANTNGGGVWANNSQFTMSGGSITGNTAGGAGGGVYKEGANRDATIIGGSICNNTCKNNGGGIYFSGGTDTAFNLGGTVVITDNHLKTGVSNNVFLQTDKTFTLGDGSTGKPKPASGMKVGLTMASVGTFVTSGAASGYTSYFVSDNTECNVTFSSGKLSLVFPNKTYEGIVFKPWTNSTSMPTSADNYYLTCDVRISSQWVVPAGTNNLDLNGHILRQTSKLESTSRVIHLENTEALNIYDSGSTVPHKFTVDSTTGLWTWNEENGTETLYGGCITGGNTGTYSAGGIYVAKGTALNMYGGNLVGNTNATTETSAPGILVAGKFNMYGGAIVGNVSTTSMTSSGGSRGGGVMVFRNGDFHMYGGIIRNNRAKFGAGVYVESYTDTEKGTTERGAFYLIGGEIRDNYGGDGAGVYNDGECNLYGGTITGNISADGYSGGGVYVARSSSCRIGKAPKVIGNIAGATMNEGVLSGGTTNNLFVASGVKVSFLTNSEYYPVSGMEIGVTMANGAGVFATTAVVSGYNTYFFSDNEKGSIVYESSSLKLTLPDQQHDNKTFKTWSDNTALPTSAGNYYLTCDVTLSSAWAVPEGTTNLCLNGHVIKQTSSSASVISLNSSAVLNLYDCSTTVRYYNRDNTTGLWTLRSSGTSDYSTIGGVIIGGVAVNGGGVFIDGGTFTMYGGNIVGNKATGSGGGGGVFIAKASSFTMYGGTVKGNMAPYGGGIYVNGTFTLEKGEISENKVIADVNYSDTGCGGGVYIAGNVYNQGSFIMNGGKICGNIADASKNGGGVYVNGSGQYQGTFTMNDGEISGNTAANGGGVSVKGTFHMIDGDILENTATGNNGSAVYVEGTYTMTDGKISNNLISTGSGTVYIANGGTFTMDGGEISGNTAKNGGGVYAIGGSLFVMNDGSITGNTATSTDANNGGGGVFITGGSTYQGSFKMNGGSITGNTANAKGGGVFIWTYANITLGGTAQITGNVEGGTITEGVLEGGTVSNLYLYSGKTVLLGTSTNGTDGNGILKPNGMKVGVTLADTTGKVVDGVAVSGDEAFFLADNKDCVASYENSDLKIDYAKQEHDNKVFQPWMQSSSLPTEAGNYYLTCDVTLSSTWTVPTGTTNLCLNGHAINQTATANVIKVPSGRTLNLYDCGTTVRYYSKDSTTGLWTPLASGTSDYVTTGGIITGAKMINSSENKYAITGGGVYVAGTFTMYGGNIVGNQICNTIWGSDYYAKGGGVYVEGGSFTMNGNSTICGNAVGNTGSQAVSGGGGVYVNGAANFTMNDSSTVSGNTMYGTSYSCSAGGVFVSGLVDAKATFTMNDNSTVKENTVIESGASYPRAGGVLVQQCIFTMNGNSAISSNISSNTSAEIGGAQSGGLFINSGAAVTMNDNSTVNDNITYSACSDSDGGGVYIGDTGTLTMNDSSTVSGNTATTTGKVSAYGGGVYLSGSTATFTMNESSSVCGNTVSGESAAYLYGGGVYLNTGIFAMNGGSVTGNTTGTASFERGGGVYVAGGTMIVGGTAQITGNVTNGVITEGVLEGGTTNNIYLPYSKYITFGTSTNGTNGNAVLKPAAGMQIGVTMASITGTLVESGAVSGDEDFFIPDIADCEVIFDNGSLKVCYPEQFHNDIHFEAWTKNTSLPTEEGNYYLTCDVTLSTAWTVPTGEVNLCLNGHVIKQTGEHWAINIQTDATLNLYDCGTTVHKFDVDGSSGLWTLNEVSGTKSVIGGCITGGKSDNLSGGGVSLDIKSTFNMYGGTIVGNMSSSTSVVGGGVYIYGGAFTMNGGSIVGNTANNENGSGVLLANGGRFTMNGGTISDNKATNGGGVHVSGGTFTMNGGVICDNKSGTSGYGGGVYVNNNGKFILTGDGCIRDNTAGYGSGVCVGSGSKFTMSGNSVIRGNKATTSGGGVCIFGGTVTMTGGSILNNSALYGGGVHVGDDSTFSMIGGRISGNTAGYNGGGVNLATTMTVGGTAVIIGNVMGGTITNGVLVGGTTNNVYYQHGKSGILLGTEDNAPKSGMNVGVMRVDSTGTIAAGSIVAAGALDDYVPYFTADATGYYIVCSEEKLYVAAIPADNYKITVIPVEHGVIYVEPQVAKDTSVKLTVVAEEGYQLKADSLKAIYNVDTALALTAGSGNSYTFTMPGEAVKVTAEFEELPPHADHDDVIFGQVIESFEDLQTLFAEGGNGYLVNTIELTAELTVGSEKTVNLCLNGQVLNLNHYSITIGSGKLNLYDCDTHTEHYFKDSEDTAGLWVWDDTLTGEAIKHTVIGGIITGGETSSTTGAICVNGGEFNMYGSTIVGNDASENGSAVYVNGGKFTMNDGGISGNTATCGGGVYVKDGTFTMNGGAITENMASDGNGGGVYMEDGTFTMNGGAISENMTADGNGGGVYVKGGTFNLGGSAVIADNSKNDTGTATDGTANNVYLAKGATINLGSGEPDSAAKPTDSMRVGVTMEDDTGTFNGLGSDSAYADYFFADDTTRAVVLEDGILKIATYQLHDGVKFETAITSEQELRALFTNGGSGYLANDITLTEALPEISGSGKTVVLCLNDHVLDLNGKGNIKVKDGATLHLYDCGKTTYKFTPDVNGLWIWDKNTDIGTKTVTGGTITGGNTTGNGGAVYVNNGSFTMYGGNIVGNMATNHSGGVYVDDGEFTLIDGTISGNVAGDGNGGGVYVSGTFTMAGGSITDNTSGGEGGGGVYLHSGTFSMTGGEIGGNTASNDSGNGGGVFINEGDFSMTGGSIAENAANGHGGGVYTNSGATVTLGGTAVINGNLQGDSTADNLYLPEDVTITLGEGDEAPAEGMNIGVTAETPVTFTSSDNSAVDYVKYFTADGADYYTEYSDNTLQLAAVPAGAHKITVIPCEHGVIYTSLQVAANNTDIILTIVPNNCYGLKSLTVNGDVATVSADGTSYTFTMPDEAVTITAEFEQVPPSITVSKTAESENVVYGTATNIAVVTARNFKTAPTLKVEWKDANGIWKDAASLGVTLGADGKLNIGATTPAGSYTFRITNSLEDIDAKFVSSDEIILTVNKSAVLPTGTPTTKTITIYINHGDKIGTIDATLLELILDGVSIKSFGTETDENNIITIDTGAKTYTFVDTFMNATATVEMTIESTNYQDFTFTLTFEMVNKSLVTVSGVSMDAAGYVYGDMVGYTGTPIAMTQEDTPASVDISAWTYTYYQTTDGGTTWTKLDAAPVDVGSYKLVVAAADTEYIGEQEILFTIEKKTITILWATNTDISYAFTYNGQDQTGNIKAGYLDNDGVYHELIVALEQNDTAAIFKNAGSYIAYVTGFADEDTGCGNYALPDTVTQTYTMKPKELTATVSATKVYDGSNVATAEQITVTVETGIDGETLTITGVTGTFNSANVADCVSVIPTNTNMTVVGGTDTLADNYVVSLPESGDASITVFDLNDATVTLDPTDYDYTGSEVKPTPVVTFDGTTIIPAADYELTYVNNIHAAASTAGIDAPMVTVTAKTGNITGSVSAKYTINKADKPETMPAAKTVSVFINAMTGKTGTIDATLLGLTLDGVSIKSFGTETDINNIITIDTDAKTYTFANTSVKATATLELTISSDDYKDFTFILTFETVDKIPVTVSGVSMDAAGYVYGDMVGYTGTPIAMTQEDTPASVDISAWTYTYYQTTDGGTTWTKLDAAPVDVGSYKLVVAAADTEYIGEQEILFTIEKKTITILWATNTDISYAFTYNGQDQTGNIKAGYLDNDGVYHELIVALEQNDTAAIFKNAGSYIAYVTGFADEGTGCGNYALPDTVTQTYTMKPKELTATVSATKVYDGSNVATAEQITVTVETGIDGETLTITGVTGIFNSANVADCVSVIPNGTNMMVSGETANLDNYVVSLPESGDASITVFDLNNATVTLDFVVYDYSGSEVKPTPVVTFNGMIAIPVTDYELIYANNIYAAASTAGINAPMVTVTAKTGNITGSVSVKFTISVISNPSMIMPTVVTGLVYAAKAQDLCFAGNIMFTAGKPDDGTKFEYAIGTNGVTAPTSGWSQNLPTGTNVGTYYVWYRWITTNYTSIAETCIGAVTIAKATPVINSAPMASTIIYGQTLASSILSHGTANVSGKFTWSISTTMPAVSDSGKTAYTVIFTPADTANYNTATCKVKLLVNKAEPVITTVPTASAIIYGQTLADSKLTNGEANVNGKFTWSGSTTMPTVSDSGKTEYTVIFTPADIANYSLATCTVKLTVNKATPTLQNVSAATIAYGTALADSTVIGTATNENKTSGKTVNGTFAFTAGTTIPAVSDSDTTYYEVTFTPADSDNYHAVTCEIRLTVIRAVPTIHTVPFASALTYGQTLANSTLTGGKANVDGTFTWKNDATAPAVSDSDKTEYTLVFTPADTENYNAAVCTVKLTVNKATPSITNIPVASAITYGQTLTNSTLTGGKANVGGTFAWRDSTILPTVSDSGKTEYTVVFTPADADNYNAVAFTVKVTVNKATPTLQDISATAITYGQILANSKITGTLTNENKTSDKTVEGTFAFMSGMTVPTVFDSDKTAYTVVFTPVDTVNYNTVTCTVKLTVNKATPTISTIPAASALIYGQTLANSTFMGGKASVDGTFVWKDSTIVPTVSDSDKTMYTVVFTPADTVNYNTVTCTVKLTVNKATPTISVIPVASVIPCGQSLTNSMLTGGKASVDGTFAWKDSTIVPTESDSGKTDYIVVFTPADTKNYNTVTCTIKLTLSKTAPIIITVPVASALTYGQSLANSTLVGGKASVDGTFTWGTNTIVPTVSDSDKTEYTVVFTPADTENYNTVTCVVKLTVNKATPTISTIPVASAITYGQTLAYSALTNGKASVDGTFTWNTDTIAPTISDSGKTEYTVVFTPADTMNYNTVTCTVKLTVNKVTPILNDVRATEITYGQTLVNSILTGDTAGVNGTFAWKDSTITPTVSDSGKTEYIVVFTPADTANYNTVTCTVKVTVNKASQNAPDANVGFTVDYINERIIPSDGYEVSTAAGNNFVANMLLGEATINFNKTYYVRVSGNDNYLASSETANNFVRPASPNAPELINITDATIVISAIDGQEYSIDDGEHWMSGIDGKVTFVGLTAHTVYDIIARKTVVTTQGKEAFAGQNSNALTVTTMRAGGAAPAVIAADVAVTDTTITLAYDATYEYKLGDGEWQSGVDKNIFTGLTAATQYTVRVRVKATQNTVASDEVMIKVCTSLVDTAAQESNIGSAKLADTNQELLEKVLTEETRAALEEGKAVIISLKVDDGEIPDGKSETVQAALGEDYTVGKWLDINLNVNVGGEVSRVTQLADDKTVTIVIDLTDSDLLAPVGVARTYKIVRIHDDAVSVLDAVFDPETNTLSFETDRWSNYGIAYSDTVSQYFMTAVAVAAVLIIALFITVIASAKKRKHKCDR